MEHDDPTDVLCKAFVSWKQQISVAPSILFRIFYIYGGKSFPNGTCAII